MRSRLPLVLVDNIVKLSWQGCMVMLRAAHIPVDLILLCAVSAICRSVANGCVVVVFELRCRSATLIFQRYVVLHSHV